MHTHTSVYTYTHTHVCYSCYFRVLSVLSSTRNLEYSSFELGLSFNNQPLLDGAPLPPRSGPLGPSFSSLGLDPPVGPMSPPQSTHSSALQLVEVEVAPVKAFLNLLQASFFLSGFSAVC